jgi:hypothetical protein
VTGVTKNSFALLDHLARLGRRAADTAAPLSAEECSRLHELLPRAAGGRMPSCRSAALGC